MRYKKEMDNPLEALRARFKDEPYVYCKINGHSFDEATLICVTCGITKEQESRAKRNKKKL